MKIRGYLVIEPKFTAAGRLASAHIARATIKPPKGGVYVGITLDVPDAAFGPLAMLTAHLEERDLQVAVAIDQPAGDA